MIGADGSGAEDSDVETTVSVAAQDGFAMIARDCRMKQNKKRRGPTVQLLIKLVLLSALLTVTFTFV